MNFISDNAAIITPIIAISAFVLSLNTFIRQHFSINVIAYPIVEGIEYRLILENVGNYPAEDTKINLNILNHHQPPVKEMLEKTPFFDNKVAITLPSKTPYSFTIGSMYQINQRTVLPVIELTIEHKVFIFFKKTKKIKIDYNIFKNKLKFG